MYCLTNLCYVCLEMKNNLVSSVDGSLPVNKELLDIFEYCAHNLAWLKTRQIILICEECCSRLRETYQFLQMWHKNSEILQGYMDELNTENEEEPLVHLTDMNQVKCEIKVEEIPADEYEPIVEEMQDVFVNTEDSLTIVEHMWKKEETDDREEYPMDNNFTDSKNNESDTDISVNSNTHIANTILKTENEAEPLIQLKDINQVKCEIKDEQIPADEYEPIIEETQDVFVNTEDSLTIVEEETDDREEYPMDNNSTESMNNESDSDISVNSNTHITDTDRVGSGVTCKQAPATNKTHSNTPANKPHTCATCSKSFTTKADLKKHTRIHTGEKPYKCERCEKCFTQQSNLVCHMRTHTGEKPYQCARCNKCFSANSSLVYHMRTHTGEKPYKCDRCDKFFRKNTLLVVHMRTHTDEKPYQCARCKKSFSLNASLVDHKRTHTGEKPYKCDRCEKCFVYKSLLVRHMLIHTGEKPYKCDRCEKCFVRNSHLVRHMRTHTGDTF